MNIETCTHTNSAELWQSGNCYNSKVQYHTIRRAEGCQKSHKREYSTLRQIETFHVQVTRSNVKNLLLSAVYNFGKFEILGIIRAMTHRVLFL